MATWNIALYNIYAAYPTQIQMEEYRPSVFDLRKISETESKGENTSEDYIITRFFVPNHHLLFYMYYLLKTISIAQITERRTVRQT